MKKLLVLLLLGVALGGCLKKEKMGALKVNTGQPATIQIDGKDMGQTPYSADALREGEISVRLTPQDTTLQPWDGLIDVTSGVWTVVNRTFANNNAQAEGYIITMEPISQAMTSISVVSDPDGAMVKMDGESVGPTPLEKNQVNAGTHSLTISAPGYKEMSLSVNSQNGYKVLVDVKLSKLEIAPIQDITEATNSAEATQSATPTGKLTPTPSRTTSPTPTTKPGSPTPTKATSATTAKGQVKILSTPTGWLRVRADASVNSKEVGRVDPGDVFDLLDEDAGWYKIELKDGTKGWVAGQYAQKM